MRDYRHQAMQGISESDYETLAMHLGDQLAGAMQGAPEGEDYKAAADALANTWQPDLTATHWLAAAAERLGVDASVLQGA